MYLKSRIIFQLVISVFLVPLFVFFILQNFVPTAAAQTTQGKSDPDFFPLAPCPSCNKPEETMPSGSQIRPSGSTSPEASNTQPCKSDSSVTDHAKKKSKHKPKSGALSKGADSILDLLKNLIAQLLELLGGGSGQKSAQPSTGGQKSGPDGSAKPETKSTIPCPPGGAPSAAQTQTSQQGGPSMAQQPAAQPSSTAGSSSNPAAGPSQSAAMNTAGGPTANTCTGNGTGGSLDYNGWTLTGCDDFNGSALDTSKWSAYDGPGHAGQGKRSPAQAKTANGLLTITGTSDGTTAGIAWKPGQKFGRWEGRLRAPASDPTYNALFILWPDAEDFPVGGEVDFVEMMDPTRQKTDFFLHYGASNSQVNGQVTIDATQWHNWAVEWTDKQITAYVDGKEWYKVTDTSKFPPRPMHMTIQLDWFPKGGGAVKQSEMQVDWVHIYQKK